MSMLPGLLAWVAWVGIVVGGVWWALARLQRRLGHARARRESQALAQAGGALERWRAAQSSGQPDQASS